MDTQKIKSKEIKAQAGPFAKGGTTKMFGPQDAAPAHPGQSPGQNGSHKPNNSFGIPKGVGKTGIVGKQRGAAPAEEGKTSVGGREGGNTFGVKGGSGHMAGYTGSTPAKPR